MVEHMAPELAVPLAWSAVHSRIISYRIISYFIIPTTCLEFVEMHNM